MPDQPNKYLIIGPAWVGDMVMAQSLFIDIKQREPQATIDVLAPLWSAALVDRMPQINKLVSADFRHGKLGLGVRYRLGRQLRDDGYTHAIVLPNSLKSALVPAFAKIPVRIGFVGEQRWGLLTDIRRLDKQALPMTAQRFVALGLTKNAELQTVPPPHLKVEQEQAVKALEKYQLNNDKPVLVLCPGAEFGRSKQWPAQHYAQVALNYLNKGWQVWLMGSVQDVAICEEINQITDQQCEVIAGKTALAEAVDLISLASLVISNDSGLMHIAAALQIPLVAVYGSTDPGHTPPLSDNHAIARLGLECSPCFKRECPLEHLNCLQQLEPRQVIQHADSLVA